MGKSRKGKKGSKRAGKKGKKASKKGKKGKKKGRKAGKKTKKGKKRAKKGNKKSRKMKKKSKKGRKGKKKSRKEKKKSRKGKKNSRKGKKKTGRKSQSNRQTDSGCMNETCINTAMSYMKIMKDKVSNFLRQKTRVSKYSTTSGNKAGKKGLFGPILNRIREAGGGNSSNLKCNGDNSSAGAKQLANL